jgi:hypothetical protein
MAAPTGGVRRGGTVVEIAFALSAAVVVCVTILDITQVIFIHQRLVERARQGATWASRQKFDAAQTRNFVVYDTPVPARGAKPLCPDLSSAMVSASLVDGGTGKGRVVVKISGYPYRFYSYWISKAYNPKTIMAVVTHQAPDIASVVP